VEGSVMKVLGSISLGLVLLCAPGLFAQSAAAPKSEAAAPAPTWAEARKNLKITFDNFVKGATRDDRGDGVFNQLTHAQLDATGQILEAEKALSARPGAAYRTKFRVTAVMCQRSAILFWQDNAVRDTTPGHFYMPPSPEIVTCMKELSAPDPTEFNDH
jgi:hypothetical protein